MIDIEAEVFSTVKQAVGSSAKVRNTYQPTEKSFPLVTIYEQSNVVASAFRDSAKIENIATVSYEVNVFSNATEKKKEAKTLMKTVDDAMVGMGFERVYLSPTPNYADSAVFRYTARYSMNTDGVNSYRR